MLSFIGVLARFGRALRGALREPEFRGLAIVVAVLLLSGTFFYSEAEDWRILDALYFSVTTLTTVGFGDPSPQTDAGKLFTIVYILVGAGLLVAFLTGIARHVAAPQSEDDASGAP